MREEPASEVRQRPGTMGSRSSSLVVVVSTAIQTAALGLFAIVSAVALGPEERGVVIIYTTLATVMMLAASAGTAIGGRMLLAKGDPFFHLRSYLHTSCVLFLAYLLVLCAAVKPLLAATRAWAGWQVALLFVGYASLTMACYMLREGMFGVGLHARAAVIDIVAPSTSLCLLLSAWLANGQTNLRAVTGYLVGGGLIQLLLALAAIRTLVLSAPRVQAPLAGFRRVVAVSRPALLSSIAQSVVIRGDRIVLGAIAGSTAVGVYGTAATLAELLWVIPLGLGQLAFSQAAHGEHRKVHRSFTTCLALSAAAALIISLLASPFVHYVLGAGYEDAVPLIWTLSGAAVAMSAYLFLAAALNGMGNLRAVAAITAVGAVILVVTCVAVIPSWGAYGAAAASIGAYVVMGTAAVVVFRRRLTRSMHSQ